MRQGSRGVYVGKDSPAHKTTTNLYSPRSKVDWRMPVCPIRNHEPAHLPLSSHFLFAYLSSNVVVGKIPTPDETKGSESEVLVP